VPVQSALFILVPEAESLVKAFREKYDPSAAAGMPAHVTVLYPFKPPSEINKIVLDGLNQCLRPFPSFPFSLAVTRRFGAQTLYLAPEPHEPFRRLTLAIWACHPETPPYGGRYREVVTHLSVADRCSDERQLDNIAVDFAQASQGKLPICAIARKVTLMDTRSGRWEVRANFRLGGNLE
jgi:2'-5' RNA ligase